MIIDIPPHVEQLIIHQAQVQGLTVSELIVQKFSEKNYARGDIRRLKNIVQSDIQASLDDINQGIVDGATHGE